MQVVELDVFGEAQAVVGQRAVFVCGEEGGDCALAEGQSGELCRPGDADAEPTLVQVDLELGEGGGKVFSSEVLDKCFQVFGGGAGAAAEIRLKSGWDTTVGCVYSNAYDVRVTFSCPTPGAAVQVGP